MRRVVAFGILALVLSTALLESGWAQQTVHPSTTAPQMTVQAPAPPSLKATTRASCNMVVGSCTATAGHRGPTQRVPEVGSRVVRSPVPGAVKRMTTPSS